MTRTTKILCTFILRKNIIVNSAWQIAWLMVWLYHHYCHNATAKQLNCATNKNPENFLSLDDELCFLVLFLFFVFFSCNFHPSHHSSLSRFISFLFYFHPFPHVHVMLCSLFSLQDIVFTCVCVLSSS